MTVDSYTVYGGGDRGSIHQQLFVLTLVAVAIYLGLSYCTILRNPVSGTDFA
ncbi:hypothetical protein QUA79_33105 [Microcoleus sp. F8-D1]